MNDPPQDNVVDIGDIPEPTNILDNPPPRFVSVVDVSSPISDDEVSEEILFEDESTTVGVLPIRTSLFLIQKSSSSKAHFPFRISSSLESSDDNDEPKENDVVLPPMENTS